MRPLRLGCGAGYAGDRIGPAAALARHGRLDVLVFECLAERTVALAQLARQRDPQAGFDRLLEPRLRAVLPECAAQGITIISNMGAANPRGAAEKARQVARDLGLRGLKIAIVEGDDIFDRRPPDLHPEDADVSPDRVLSANAYLGAAPILQALQLGADIVLTGRVADPSLFVAPVLHHFGWAADDWHRLGQATLAGHMLECAAQVTGGYFADPGRKEVPGLDDPGFPIGVIAADGGLEITKLAQSGGSITLAGCKEQMLYEVFDPAAYLTPDVTADFSRVRMTRPGPDRVRLEGATGRPAPERLKVSMGYRAGFLGEASISYCGSTAGARARLATGILARRLARETRALELRCDTLGDNALSLGCGHPGPEPLEASARAAGLYATEAEALQVGDEVEALYVNGPFGGGGVRRSVEEVIAITSAYVPRDSVTPRVEMLET
ncbi:acyclic terpene utilization AtuA family protein [Pseudodonghicola flavimaris]|uniref:DUF1446 domain-containing protein n=1 Tax=Pseudodonghicola flavimaris TaxID=3050036 RepID=A0ABT7F529_9RHOB|nr:acyclic terpene utilization AtuA family protein [Pseudodonghicola flavimaris]MDK3019706.1 DUF1446 domain-containing protein [Pseudodonghicola flavimaris]